jgi:hypothetical protein
MFSFEKKNQKTFIRLGVMETPRKYEESLFASFSSEKEGLSCFIAAARQAGVWDRGYVQSVGGVCLIVGDELWFYYTGFRGDPANHRDRHGYHAGMYAHGATGIAKLRRDGFASLRAGALEQSVLTRPVTFTGGHLFVNATGTLRAEVCTEQGVPIPGFTAVDCLENTGDHTKVGVRWRGDANLARLAGQPVRFRFYLQHGDLYAFWVSHEATGASTGYVAAGGPGFSSSQDLPSTCQLAD